MTKRTEITIEIDQVIVIRRRRKVLRAWCAACAEKVEMVTADEAAVAASVDLGTVHCWVKACAVHFRETPEGLLFVCLNSLYSLPYDVAASPVESDREPPRKQIGGAEQTHCDDFQGDGFQGGSFRGDGFTGQADRGARHFALSMLRAFRRIISSLL